MAGVLASAKQLWLLLPLLSLCVLGNAFGTADDDFDKGRPCGCANRTSPDGRHLWTCTGNDELTELHRCFVATPEMPLHSLALRNVSMDVLAPGSAEFASRLEFLSLDGCRFKELNLEGATNLVSLNLSYNQLQAVHKPWFAPLVALRLLNLTHNRLTTLPADLTHDLPTVTSLDLSHNLFEELRASWFGPSPSLLNLNASHNLLEATAPSEEEAATLWGGHLASLLTLDLSWNQLRSASGLDPLQKLVSLRLDHNWLSALPPGAFLNNTQLVHHYLAGNVWHCDDNFVQRRHAWLTSLTAQLDKHRPGPELHDVAATVCASPPRWKGRSAFLFGFALCERCACVVSESLWIEVNCTGRALEELPSELPVRTRVLWLANNRVKSLMPPANGVGWESLLMLDVHGNEISSIDLVVTTRVLRSLMGLNLTHNRLSRLPSHVLEHLREHSMDEVRLSGNPWLCNCDTVAFVSWLQDNKMVKDVEEIRCSDGGGLTGKTIYALPKSDLCPQPTDWTQGLLDALSGLMALAIIAILAKLLRDYLRQKRTGKLPTFFSFV